MDSPTPKPPTRVAIYARVSTNDQDVGMQLRDLRNYSAARDFQVFQEYYDRGVSGAKTSRPYLDRLMNDARKKRFDAVLVWRFDRFARSTRHLTLALEEFRVLGIQFISYNENIDTSTPMGQAMFSIIAAMAQLERDIIRERVRAAVRHARASGKRLGRPRSASIDEVRRLRALGYSIRTIAGILKTSTTSIQRALRARKRSA